MIELFQKGGFAMYPMLVLSIIAIAISIERFVYLRRAKTDADSFMFKINEFLSRNALDAAYNYCEKASFPISRIIKAGLKNQRLGRAEVVRAIEDAGALEVAILEKGILILQMISKVAPLMGLFGTVTGMIQSFQAMGSAGGENPRLVAAGIGEALIATAGGLVVAIPAYFLSFYFVNEVNKFLLDMQKSSIQFLDAMNENEEKLAKSRVLDTIGGNYLEI
jgi:biopolymer transport protein ExbB